MFRKAYLEKRVSRVKDPPTEYSRSHGPLGGGELESLSRLGVSAMILVLSFLAKAIFEPNICTVLPYYDNN
jgi:hypothetical protein